MVEALVGSQCDGIRALEVAGGFPDCCWPFLVPALAMYRNTEIHDDGKYAWYERFCEHLEGQRIALGALVWFRPSVTKYKLAKILPRFQPGVFLGYELAPACRWKTPYMVADLESFKGDSSKSSVPGN